MTNPRFIAVDWGTSYLRAFLCDASNGKIHLFDKSKSHGVTKVVTSFEETLHTAISKWQLQHPNLPILMAGQIGSSIGWKETQYLACPIAPEDLASSCLRFKSRGHHISVVPGLSCLLPNQNYDLMRGEELEVLGWLQQDEAHRKGRHMLCLPGTHTKWVVVENGKIMLFKTAMTGELFDLLLNYSVIIQDTSSTIDKDAFEQGARFTLQSEAGSFVHGLFSVRSKQLFGQIESQYSGAYLSGLLIGSDVRAAINAEEWDFSDFTSVSLIGASKLCDLFLSVLKMQGVNAQVYPHEDISLAGFSRLFELSHLYQESQALGRD